MRTRLTATVLACIVCMALFAFSVGAIASSYEPANPMDAVIVDVDDHFSVEATNFLEEQQSVVQCDDVVETVLTCFAVEPNDGLTERTFSDGENYKKIENIKPNERLLWRVLRTSLTPIHMWIRT